MVARGQRAVPRLRRWTACGLLLLLLPLAHGQGESEPVTVAEDPAGDVAVTVEGQPVPYGSGLSGRIDLAALVVQETMEHLVLEVRMHDGITLNEDATDARVYFEHGRYGYLVDFSPPNEVAMGAAVYRYDIANDVLDLVGDAELEETPGNLQQRVHVPREWLINEHGAPPFPSSVLSGWVVDATVLEARGPEQDGIKDHDIMPNSGTGADYAIQLGDVFSGTLRAFSPSPSRASNGGEATYVYPVVVENNDDAAVQVVLEWSEAPPSWQVHVPIASFEVAAGEREQVPVIVTTPFGHQHGGVDEMTVTARAFDRPTNEASVALRIVYHETPQPAGHHNEFWFHSRPPANTAYYDPLIPDPTSFLYFNTKDVDDGDAGVDVRGTHILVTHDAFLWRVHLHPSLQMGLDFDLDGTGLLRVPIEVDVPMLAATMSGTLRLQGPEPAVLGTFEATQPQPINIGETVWFEMPFAPHPVADYVPFHKDQTLHIDLELAPDRPAGRTTPESPRLVPGGSMVLPLLEYRDQVPAALDAVSGFRLQGDRTHALANPGDLVLFTVNMTGPARGVELSVSSTRPDWLDLSRKFVASLDEGETTTVHVAVRVPDDGREGFVADTILNARAANGDTALLRLSVEVDEERAHPDASDAWNAVATDDRRESPAVAVAGLAALAVAGVLRRRVSN